MSDQSGTRRLRAPRVLALGLLVLLLAAGPSGARAVTCSVESTGLSFGQYNPFLGVPNDSVGTISLSCGGAPGTTVMHTIRLGPGSSGTSAARVMRSSSGWALGYNLYTDPARSLVWGDGSGGTRVLVDAMAVGAMTRTRRYPVFGRTFARQNVTPGVYADSLVITVEF